MLTENEARAAFLHFPSELRAAMKTDAQAEGWTARQWIEETWIVTDILQQNDHTQGCIEALLNLYGRIASEKPRSRKTSRTDPIVENPT